MSTCTVSTDIRKMSAYIRGCQDLAGPAGASFFGAMPRGGDSL